MKKRIILRLTDFAVHARDFRPAKTLEAATKEKAADGTPRGRFYMNQSLKVNPDGTFRVEMQLPEELQRQVEAGEVEVVVEMPEGGVPIFASKDVQEKIAQHREQERLRLAKSGRVWKKGVK